MHKAKKQRRERWGRSRYSFPFFTLSKSINTRRLSCVRNTYSTCTRIHRDATQSLADCARRPLPADRRGNTLATEVVGPGHLPQAVGVGLGLEGHGVVDATAMDALVVRALADGGTGLGVDHEGCHHPLVFVEEDVAVMQGHSSEVQIFGSEYDVLTSIDVHHIVGACGWVCREMPTSAYNNKYYGLSSYRWP